MNQHARVVVIGGGAKMHLQTCVTGIAQKSNGEWLVHTDQGDVTCEHIISATDNFARRTGAMVGLDIPVLPVEHHYVVTEAHDDIRSGHTQGLPELGVLRESDGSWYMREESGGLLLGPYEFGAPKLVCTSGSGPRGPLVIPAIKMV